MLPRTVSILLCTLTLFCSQASLGWAKKTFTITDDNKNTLVFTAPFQRIISLYPAHTRNLIDLGIAEKIIAVSRSDHQLPDRPALSYHDDPERFIALQPDLVLIRPMIARNYPQLVSRLRQSKIQVVSLQPKTIHDLFDYWQTLGELTGRQEKAKQLVTTFTFRLHDLQKKVALIPEDERQKVYFEAIHKKMKTFAKHSMAMFVLETAGGINIAEDAIQVRTSNIAMYSKEKIISKAKQIDIFLAQQGKMNPVSKKDILNEPGFKIIKAIRENKVFLIDEKLVSRPTMGLLDAIETIMHYLYPEQETSS